jgi:hypothetical protein
MNSGGTLTAQISFRRSRVCRVVSPSAHTGRILSSNPLNSVGTAFPLMLGRRLRLKTAFPVPGDFDSHRPTAGSQVFGGFPVPAVCLCFFTLVMFLIPKMKGQSSFPGSPGQRLGKLLYNSLGLVKIIRAVIVLQDFIRKLFLKGHAFLIMPV